MCCAKVEVSPLLLSEILAFLRPHVLGSAGLRPHFLLEDRRKESTHLRPHFCHVSKTACLVALKFKTTFLRPQKKDHSFLRPHFKTTSLVALKFKTAFLRPHLW